MSFKEDWKRTEEDLVNLCSDEDLVNIKMGYTAGYCRAIDRVKEILASKDTDVDGKAKKLADLEFEVVQYAKELNDRIQSEDAPNN